MVKSRTFQLIFQSMYLAFAIVATISSTGFFDHRYLWDFYIFFTNISNYFCGIVMAAELIQTARRQGDGNVSAAPRLKFVALLSIVLTALVFNLLLAGDPSRNPDDNFRVSSVLFHVVLPLMYTADWLLFYRHRRAKWTWPLLSTLFPLAYLAFLFVHAAALGFDAGILDYYQSTPLIYPYFFVRVDQIGIGGVLKWCGVLLAGFLTAGYLLMGIDRLLPEGGAQIK